MNGEIFYSLKEAQILIERWRQHYNTIRPHSSLGGVDKFEPVSDCSNVDHAEEAAGELIISCGHCTVDLQMPEHAFYAAIVACIGHGHIQSSHADWTGPE